MYENFKPYLSLWCVIRWLTFLSSWKIIILWSILLAKWDNVMKQCAIFINIFLHVHVYGCTFAKISMSIIVCISFSLVEWVNASVIRATLRLHFSIIYSPFIILKVGPLAAYYQVPLRHILLVCLFCILMSALQD